MLKSESPTPTDVSVEDENTSNQASLLDDPSKSEAEHGKPDEREFESEKSFRYHFTHYYLF